MTEDEALDLKIKSAQGTLNTLLEERRKRRAAAAKKAIDASPYKVGDRVTTKLAYSNYTVERVNPKSVVVSAGWGEDRIPFDRLLPADPSKDRSINDPWAFASRSFYSPEY
jgi:hypothetical protein